MQFNMALSKYERQKSEKQIRCFSSFHLWKMVQLPEKYVNEILHTESSERNKEGPVRSLEKVNMKVDQ